MNKETLEKEVSIDLHDLENELVRQVDNYHEVAKNYREAISIRDEAKTALTEVRAESYFEARKLVEAEQGKPTEAMVNARLENLDVVVDVQSALEDAQRDLNYWLALKETYDQRSYALNKLVDLYISGYFGVSPALSAREKTNEAKEQEVTKKYRASKKKSSKKRSKRS